MELTLSTEGISPGEKREALARILESKEFQRAAKLREFLRFVCERSMYPESGASVHEQDPGKAVYQRRDDYNPSEDNIVRVEARNLRQKLARFYNGAGLELPIIVRIPKGAYIAGFERRTVMEVVPAPQAESSPGGREPGRGRFARHPTRRRQPAGCAGGFVRVLWLWLWL